MAVGEVVGIVLAVVVVIALLLLSKSIYVVHQAESIIIERLGRFQRVLKPGVSFIVPFIDSPRSFQWRMTQIDSNGNIVDTPTDSYRIDLRESVFNFLRQEVFTKDGVVVDVNALMYYHIDDVLKAVYEVDDLQVALSNTAQTQLKEVFGNMTFTQALGSQQQINDHLIKEFAKTFFNWGIHVERMELLDLLPKEQTSKAMKKQMIAERSRRGEFIRSEGNKASMRLVAEGTKMVKLNNGLAEQEATRKRSEGEAGAKVELARAESTVLDSLASAIISDGASNVQYQLAQRFMDLLRVVNERVDRKKIFLPYQVQGLRGMIDEVVTAYGQTAPTAARKAPAQSQQYSALD